MTLNVAPMAIMPSPGVRLVLKLGSVLLVDRLTLEDAEPYGDCITHRAGHYELWKQWQVAGAAKLRSLGHLTQKSPVRMIRGHVIELSMKPVTTA